MYSVLLLGPSRVSREGIVPTIPIYLLRLSSFRLGTMVYITKYDISQYIQLNFFLGIVHTINLR